MDQDLIRNEIQRAYECLMSVSSLKAGQQLVIGCSTSEIAGEMIGKAGDPGTGETVAKTILDCCRESGIIPVYQCCEHLNRALVMEKEAAERFGYQQCNAVPQPHAGGSVASAAWKLMREPCLCISVQADAGIDIGDTLIGMHLKPVAVPVHGSIRKIGQANLVMAYSRLPYIGGARAVYQQ